MTAAIQIKQVISLTQIKQRIACLQSWIEIVKELPDGSINLANYQKELAELNQQIISF